MNQQPHSSHIFFKVLDPSTLSFFFVDEQNPLGFRWLALALEAILPIFLGSPWFSKWRSLVEKRRQENKFWNMTVPGEIKSMKMVSPTLQDIFQNFIHSVHSNWPTSPSH